MKKSITAIIASLTIILLMFAISGCTTSNTVDTYHTGTTGVAMEFPTSNPKDLFENSDFGYSVLLRNLGAYTVGNNQASLSVSYDSYYISMAPGEKFRTFSLHARDINYPIGDQNYTDVLFKTKTIGTASAQATTTLGFTLCYPYQTQATIAACIDTEPTYDNAVACRASVYTNNAGQGGPVGVVKIEPEMMYMGNNQVKPQFKIYIQNLGKGIIINKSQADICAQNNPALFSQNINRIKVSAMLSDRNLVCEPQELHLNPTGENYVKCSLVPGANGYDKAGRNFVSPLTITLDYAYVETNNQQINIKSTSQQAGTTSVSCAATEKAVNGVCVPLCDYCAKNPSASECQNNKPITSFQFDSSFGCFCSQTKCDELTPLGKCIPGYCTGTDNCCSTTECDDKPDGTQCGDNYVCLNKKCSTTTECAYAEKTASSGFACRPAAQCDPNMIVTGLCPGNADNVCCPVNTCLKQPDGTKCADNHVCISGVCDLVQTSCDFQFSSQGYACRDASTCDPTATKPGLCSTSRGVCCKQATGECVGQPEGTTCGDHYVCLQNKCSTTTECQYAEQSVNNGFACRPTAQCDPNETVDSLCPTSLGACCILKQ